jgi:hypothetical protein
VLSSQPSMKSAVDGLRRVSVPTAVVGAPAEIVRGADHSAKQRSSAVQPRGSREEIECERARHEDRAGNFVGYPCWAREALSRGIGRR